jgi:diadenosine tetraphosphate (Ap4A) HIT family hydrolase
MCVSRPNHTSVNEPFELPASEQSAFWRDVLRVARAVAGLLDPVKMNYEIHGNTVSHLHLHLFPRHTDDPYVGGPIDPSGASFRRSAEELDGLRSSFVEALGPDD